MSKMKLLLDVVSDLRSLADSLQAWRDAVAQGGQEQPDQTTEEQPVQKPEKKTAAKKKESSTEEEGQLSKPLSLEQVRAAPGGEVPRRTHIGSKGAPDQAWCR